MSMFDKAFKNNFYLTEEFAEFCSKVTEIDFVKQERIFILKNKVIAISNHDSKLKNKFRKDNLNYMTVLPKLNKEDKSPSFVEYSLFLKKSYESAFKNYKKSFRKQLRQGKEHPFTVRMIRKPDEGVLDDVYSIYVKQMKRHNSYILPKSFFVEYMKLHSSLLFLIEYDKDLVAYSFCFENRDNLYTSFGGGNPRYFKYRCMNVLYDSRIKYACKKGLNIHAGMGMYGSGYNRFKGDAGAVNYKCERFPEDTKKLKLAVWLSNCKLVGLFCCLLSRLFPKKLVYTIMPFT